MTQVDNPMAVAGQDVASDQIGTRRGSFMAKSLSLLSVGGSPMSPPMSARHEPMSARHESTQSTLTDLAEERFVASLKVLQDCFATEVLNMHYDWIAMSTQGTIRRQLPYAASQRVSGIIPGVNPMANMPYSNGFHNQEQHGYPVEEKIPVAQEQQYGVQRPAAEKIPGSQVAQALKKANSEVMGTSAIDLGLREEESPVIKMNMCIPSGQDVMPPSNAPPKSGASSPIGGLPFGASSPTGSNMGMTKSQRRRINLDHIEALCQRLHGKEYVTGQWQKFVFSPLYNWIITFFVIAQATILGVEMQLTMQYEHERMIGETPHKVPDYLMVFSITISAFFLFEVIFRIVVLGPLFFHPCDRDAKYWNYFDLFLVICCLPDFFPFVELADFPLVRAVRLLRVIRVLRIARVIQELRKMVFALLHCLSSLFWLVALMALLLYMFALAFLQGASSDLETRDPNPEIFRRLKAKGDDCVVEFVSHPYEKLITVADAMQGLFHMVTGEMEWEDVLKPVMDSNWFYTVLGFFFSVFFLFGFMNVATGFFVEKAMQIASQDREMLMIEAKRKEDAEVQSIKEIFSCADLDGDGKFSKSEMREIMDHPDVRQWLNTINLDLSGDFEAVLKILADEKGSVPAEKFYAAIGRFRGPARRLEARLAIEEARTAVERVEKLHMMHLESLQKLHAKIS